MTWCTNSCMKRQRVCHPDLLQHMQMVPIMMQGRLCYTAAMALAWFILSWACCSLFIVVKLLLKLCLLHQTGHTWFTGYCGQEEGH